VSFDQDSPHQATLQIQIFQGTIELQIFLKNCQKNESPLEIALLTRKVVSNAREKGPAEEDEYKETGYCRLQTSSPEKIISSG